MTIDLINWVETTYRAASGKPFRSIMGNSMGGYGSFRYAVLKKEYIRGIAAHASAIHIDVASENVVQEIKAENAPGPPYSYDYTTAGTFTKLVFGMAGAFTPNSSSTQDYINPQVVDFPLDETGELIDSIYNRILAYDPISYIDNLSNSDSVAILFGVGQSDELYLYQSNLAFKDTLERIGTDI